MGNAFGMACGPSLLRVAELSALLEQSQRENKEKEKRLKTLNNTVELQVCFTSIWSQSRCRQWQESHTQCRCLPHGGSTSAILPMTLSLWGSKVLGSLMLPVQIHLRHFSLSSLTHLLLVLMFPSSLTLGCMSIHVAYLHHQVLHLGSNISPQCPDGFTSVLPLALLILLQPPHRDLSELKAEQMRLSGAMLVNCSLLNTSVQVWESVTLD